MAPVSARFELARVDCISRSSIEKNFSIGNLGLASVSVVKLHSSQTTSLKKSFKPVLTGHLSVKRSVKSL